MSNLAQKITQRYRELACVPFLSDARIGKNGATLSAVWSERNLERGKFVKFSKTYLLNSELRKYLDFSPCDVTSEKLVSISPSETYRAIVRASDEKDGAKQFFEIWSDERLLHTTDVSELELHDEIYTEATLGALEWSPDETKLIYIAEKKEPKSEPFYKKKTTNSDPSKDANVTKGEQYLYRQSWGEQYTTRKESVIVQYDRACDSFSILDGIPDDIFPIQVSWSPDGTCITGVGLRTNPRKLGLIYCNNRPAAVFTLNFDKQYEELSMKSRAVRNPLFTPDGKTIVWFEQDEIAHSSCLALVKKSVLDKSASIQTVVPIVNKEMKINGDRLFYGLYNVMIPKRCWASGNRLILSTQQKNTINTYCINIDSGAITELPYSDGSRIVLDVFNDTVVFNHRNFFVSDKLAIATLPKLGSECTLESTDVTDGLRMDYMENFTYNYLDLAHNTEEVANSFTAIYIGPKSGKDGEYPLIAWPHGGPHSAYSNCLFLELSLLNSLGFAVLLINFRGSIGAGEDSIKFLLGKVGKADVQDCVEAVKAVLTRYPWLDASRVSLMGGSHGGFLVTHLSGQYPSMFRAVVARNPVIDIAAMSITSDIPDWAYVETGRLYTQVGQPNVEDLLEMRKASPIQHAHRVTAPTLLQIGKNDKRVDPSQGIEYYHRLKANGNIVRMNLYDDNHPIASIHNEVDNIINSILWVMEHTEMKYN
ncbi:hypothetical protein PPYR_12463 [Photinus pyralis]|uniref:acylaminoacyl-peptidase n=1 Tax=Photinus pyralis TaxID=7054 RepID=A0A5N4ADI7_PHOPY|nr:acylamino-acid-releasing enzyme-like [Photinus pyralis]XP_031349903.1 acylamino-acid-releasing enzyme-like [Photinus pyralis]KAB0795385.1 hypothetical protein PPYR_12224 [Photinus pyralis]KAB0795624.1 hypothetical protein PPYR_12463 [Photinus pyralis]